jgi:flagellar hook-length control protein FliK
LPALKDDHLQAADSRYLYFLEVRSKYIETVHPWKEEVLIPNIAVGSPMLAMTEPKSAPDKISAKDFKNAGNPDTSFKQALGNKFSKSEKVDKLSLPEKDDKAEKKESREEVKSTKDDRPKSEAKGESKKEVIDKAEGQRSKKASTRQQAIQGFMDSFESEFEIPPTRLVEAMANLDDAELTKSPEDTVNAVIDQLDLDDSQAEKARTMYAALLLQLQQTQPPAQPVPLTETTMGTGLGQQSMQIRAQTAHDKQLLVQQSVDKLNASFRMRPGLDGKLAPEAMSPDMMQNLDIDESSFADQGEDIASMMGEAAPVAPQAEMPKMEELSPHLQGQMKDALAPGLLAALAARKAEMAAATAEKTEGMAAVGGDEASADILAEFSQALQAPKGLDKPIDPQALKALMQQNQNQGQGQNLMQQDAQSQSFMKEANEFFKGIAGKAKEATETVSSTKGGDFKDSLSGLEGLQAQPIKGESFRMDAAMPVAAAGQAGPANPAENEAAVKQLMNQAQYLIKKGGGEMKVEMTPEGMGTVHLKVMMQDGKVNLQMATDTQEAKKTIENSLAELKTSLAAHKLSVENVKIDVVNNVSTDTATQNQPNANNGNGGREQSRQFWNQFNENFGSQGRRESFSDMPGLKSYGRSRDPLTPIQTASERPRAMEGKGSGLNLVA